MEKKNTTQVGIGQGLELQLTDFGESERNRIYLPRLPGLARLGLPRFDFSELLKGGESKMTIENFMSERVDHYVRLFEALRNKVGDDQLAVALLDQCGKDWRVSQMRENDQRPSGNGSARSDTPATPKQRAFLERLQVKYIPQNLSRMQASRMINEAQLRVEAA